VIVSALLFATQAIGTPVPPAELEKIRQRNVALQSYAWAGYKSMMAERATCGNRKRVKLYVRTLADLQGKRDALEKRYGEFEVRSGGTLPITGTLKVDCSNKIQIETTFKEFQSAVARIVIPK
jgi:hypothetical protein